MNRTGPAKHVAVIGGGISGLTIAFYLVEMGFRVSVYEKADRVGGLLGTTPLSTGMVESAANAFMANKAIEDISEKISVPLMEKKKEARKRFIFRDGQPRRWALDLGESLKLIPFICRWFLNRESLKPKRQESLESWGERHLGLGIVQFLLGPAMQGVYGVQPCDLSANLLLGRFFKSPLFTSLKCKDATPEDPKGQLKGSVSPEKGMGAWVDGLKTYLQSQGVEFVLEAERLPEKSFDVPVIVATDLANAKPWLKSVGLAVPDAIKMTALTSVTLHLGPESAAPPAGFGCLFPKKENFHSLGVLYNHHIFTGRKAKGLSETWIFDQAPAASNTVDFREKVLKDRARLAEGPVNIENLAVRPWPKAIPVYSTDLEVWLESFPGHSQNVFFMGNYLGQIGLSKLAIQAKRVAELVQKEGKWHVTEL